MLPGPLRMLVAPKTDRKHPANVCAIHFVRTATICQVVLPQHCTTTRYGLCPNSINPHLRTASVIKARGREPYFESVFGPVRLAGRIRGSIFCCSAYHEVTQTDFLHRKLLYWFAVNELKLSCYMSEITLTDIYTMVV